MKSPVEDPAEEASESPEVESAEGPSGEKLEATGSVKVPESFQKAATALCQQCNTMACVDFLQSEVAELRQKLSKTQTEGGLDSSNFSSEEMPE